MRYPSASELSTAFLSLDCVGHSPALAFILSRWGGPFQSILPYRATGFDRAGDALGRARAVFWWCVRVVAICNLPLLPWSSVITIVRSSVVCRDVSPRPEVPYLSLISPSGWRTRYRCRSVSAPIRNSFQPIPVADPLPSPIHCRFQSVTVANPFLFLFQSAAVTDLKLLSTSLPLPIRYRSKLITVANPLQLPIRCMADPLFALAIRYLPLQPGIAANTCCCETVMVADPLLRPNP